MACPAPQIPDASLSSCLRRQLQAHTMSEMLPSGPRRFQHMAGWLLKDCCCFHSFKKDLCLCVWGVECVGCACARARAGARARVCVCVCENILCTSQLLLAFLLVV